MSTFRHKHPHQWIQADVAEAIAAGHYRTHPFGLRPEPEGENLRNINRAVSNTDQRTAIRREYVER